ncbi:hypothetical protein L2E82_40349 [Cichorium intybus]|uniref:Uncharacterized protein n=1 Tax=Cichorium intybus TaxID=13427 RepID=A0ACB9ALP9_CICIN|nr:hypothetical protein L2E82_40349 [Cichorium intybus]
MILTFYFMVFFIEYKKRLSPCFICLYTKWDRNSFGRTREGSTRSSGHPGSHVYLHGGDSESCDRGHGRLFEADEED